MKVYIWGTGKIASMYLNTKEFNEEWIIGFVETHRSKEEFRGKRVFEPSEITGTAYDKILVLANSISKSVLEVCKQNGIDEDKLWFIDDNCWYDGKGMNVLPQVLIRKTHENDKNAFPVEKFPVLNSFYTENERSAQRYIVAKNNGFGYKKSIEVNECNNGFEGIEYKSDYFRFMTFDLMANEILKADIPGDVAELGVYKGTFSKLINFKFPMKKLYLFDTFESFSTEEFQHEVQEGRCEQQFMDVFKDTSVEYVLNNMQHKEQCVVKKGFFPESAAGCENLSFCFVSIDVDFEQSILEGLRYFYPRLNQGGAIFIHDYNNYGLEGVKEAVSRYEKENQFVLHKVPIADEGGTLIVVK